MHEGRMLRSLTPQQRLAVYRNRVFGAAWLLILAGALTAAEPFTQLHARLGVSLGLLAPRTLSATFVGAVGYQAELMAAAAGGAVLAALGIAAGLDKLGAAIAGVAVLALDFACVMVNRDLRLAVPEVTIPVIVTAVIRFSFVRYVAAGIRAFGLRDDLIREMAAADREYEATRLAEAAFDDSRATPASRTAQPPASCSRVERG